MKIKKLVDDVEFEEIEEIFYLPERFKSNEAFVVVFIYKFRNERVSRCHITISNIKALFDVSMEDNYLLSECITVSAN